MFRKSLVLLVVGGLVLGTSPAASARAGRVRAQVAAAAVAQTLPGPGACQIPDRVGARVWRSRLDLELRGLSQGFAPLIPLAALKPAGAADASDPERAVRLAYLMVRYHYDAAGHDGGRGRDWTVAELDVILAALHDFPSNLLPLDDDYRVIDGGRQSNLVGLASPPLAGAPVVALQAAGPGAILLGDRWHGLPAAEQRGTVFHELAHDFAAARGRYADWRPAWRTAVEADEAWAARIGEPSSYVSRYAAVNVDEDMAESAVAYRYRPQLLKYRAPARYAFLRAWMFDGLEYFTPDQCLDPQALSEQVARRAADLMVGNADSPVEVRETVQDCARDPMFAIYQLSQEQCWLLGAFRNDLRQAWAEKAPPPAAGLPADAGPLADRIYFLVIHLALVPDARRRALVERHRAMSAGAGP